jgi:hypothetical protein
VTLQTFHVNTTVPTGSQDLRDTARITAIGLVTHCSERCADLACFKADHLESGGLQAIGQVLRECAGFKANNLQVRTPRMQARNDAINIGLNLRLMPNLATFIDHADRH